MVHHHVLKQGSALRGFEILLLLVVTGVAAAQGPGMAVEMSESGRLLYRPDENGNRIPDFSHCGYEGANRSIPHVDARVVVRPAEGDDGAQIQAAIDYVAQLPLDEHGFRGAVVLGPGQFEIEGQLRISESGIVLRGSGAGERGTRLLATGRSRRELVRIRGRGGRRRRDATGSQVMDEYIPVGAARLQLQSADQFRVGDEVIITRPSTQEWITALGMDAFGVAWKPGMRDIRWDRVIQAIDGNEITVDAPITTAIEMRLGGATVQTYDWPGRIANVGLEDLQLLSAYDQTNPHDEEHAWFGVAVNGAKNVWIRRVEFRHFAGGAVVLGEDTKWITISDCISLEPISATAGYRRHTFFTRGQLTLFLRCWSEEGRHDFAVGYCAAGPNAFVHCEAVNALAGSGPIESWASGVLYSNVRIDGGGLDLGNRWSMPPGTGWSAANCVLWQCQAATMSVFRPPTANNWAIGVWGEFAGDGTWQGRSETVRPINLYEAQLRDRRGREAAADVGIDLLDTRGATNPSPAKAAEFTRESRQPRRQLTDFIREKFAKNVLPGSPPVDGSSLRGSSRTGIAGRTDRSSRKVLSVRNGWLVVDDALKTGGLMPQPFWRGTMQANESAAMGPAITRFAPGRIGTGFTDDLQQVAHEMRRKSIAAFDHHYGLWYDRRRDDHTIVRRADGNVVPPFYEQPFARTGRGRAWDGLGKYDLTQFNPWYWNRLHEFAKWCEIEGLVLFHQNYFQHNILEAGAHWADSPWRPANHVNDTGLPEPPVYIGEKRIFMAEQFYDITNSRLRALHRNYIRKCLDNFADCSNVVQLTSAEYSGPLPFTQFWLDTIIEWQQETSHDVLVAISAPKDVQDAILNDAKRSPHVDIIDIRYWAYAAGDQVFAPKGGQNLAPRQALRQSRQKAGGFEAIARAVREYRVRFSGKAITYYADLHCPSRRDGWAVLFGGGSLPNVRLPERLARAVPTMAPADDVVRGEGIWCLADEDGDCLIYSERVDRVLQINPRKLADRYRLHSLDSETGTIMSSEEVKGAEHLQASIRTNIAWLEAVSK